MNTNWEELMRKLNACPLNTHKLLPPCLDERFEGVQSELGKMPKVLIDMLKHFNGGEIFVTSAPFASIFGVSTFPPLPSLQWPPDWYIDKFTPVWRSVSENRRTDWVIAIMNYGGLIILAPDGTTREWDTSQGEWASKTWNFGEWLEEILRKGEAYIKE